MPWWVGTFIGSFFLLIVVSMSRTYDISLKILSLMMIPLILSNIGFWYGFHHSPKFIVCWFMGVSINTIIAFFLGLLIFDKGISVNTMIGIPFILFGAYLMVR